MKVVHISFSDTGGSGSAAIRLHRGLLDAGVDSKFLCFNKNSFEEKVYQYQDKVALNFFKRLIQKLGIPVTKEKANQRKLKKYKGDYEIFSFPCTDFNVLSTSIVKDADIINLHWIADYLDYPTFFSGIKIPVVWTLHDKNPTLGGFHLLTDKERNPLFLMLENKLSEKKYEYIKKATNLNVVSPSQFLLNYSKSSKNLGKFQHHHIANSIDTNVFKHYEQDIAKKVFNLPLNKKIILFLDSISYHKGADAVVKCIDNNKYEDIQFVALGIGYTSQHSNVINIKKIENESLMAQLYSSADLFILPSREDNLPNMMLEALACGTPVLGFPTGGIIDVIENGFNGLVTSELSANALHIGITDFFSMSDCFDRKLIRDFSVEHFDISVQARKYKLLYNSIIENII